MESIKDIDLSGKRVLVRLDLDVDEKGDDYRLQAAIPTLKHLLGHNNKLILIGHLGRPNGRVSMDLSLKPVSERLSKLLGRPIDFVDNFQIPERDIVMLENLRFDPGEEKNSHQFVAKLASLADFYVNEAFADSHRNHASIVGVAKLLPHAAGLRLVLEIENLSDVLKSPKKPFVALIAGAKFETKEPFIVAMAKVADRVLVGGKVADDAKKSGKKYPRNVTLGALNEAGKDMDEVANEEFSRVVAGAKTLVWNGPLGIYEEGRLVSTRLVADAVKSSTKSIIGGGDLITALGSLKMLEKFSWVSVGGGAMMEFLSGIKLPGLTALE